MLEVELVQLVKRITSEKCEKQHIELKKASGGTPSKLYDILSRHILSHWLKKEKLN